MCFQILKLQNPSQKGFGALAILWRSKYRRSPLRMSSTLGTIHILRDHLQREGSENANLCYLFLKLLLIWSHLPHSQWNFKSWAGKLLKIWGWNPHKGQTFSVLHTKLGFFDFNHFLIPCLVNKNSNKTCSKSLLILISDL